MLLKTTLRPNISAIKPPPTGINADSPDCVANNTLVALPPKFFGVRSISQLWITGLTAKRANPITDIVNINNIASEINP